jgi:putative NADH-flavin reductase
VKITIVGASAGVGLESVKRALERGHQVTALSRSVISLPSHPSLTTLEGSALNPEDLKKSVENADAVIVALGTGKSMKPTTLYSGFAHLLAGLPTEVNFQAPVIVLTGFGAGDSGAYNTFFMKLFFRWFLKDVYADKTLMEEIITGSDLHWVIVRPGLLKNNPLTEQYKVETSLYKGMKTGSISRSDVADYMVKQAEHPTNMNKYSTLSYT